jgi:hypothetical protein
MTKITDEIAESTVLGKLTKITRELLDRQAIDHDDARAILRAAGLEGATVDVNTDFSISLRLTAKGPWDNSGPTLQFQGTVTDKIMKLLDQGSGFECWDVEVEDHSEGY